MKRISVIATFFLVLTAFSYISDAETTHETGSGQGFDQSSAEGSASGKELEKGMYAIIMTSKGDITCKLYEKEVPLIVDNFVGLATGTGEHMDFREKKWVKGKFYDGLLFHRVIPNFIIQAGCPFGSGVGGPGYRLKDEFHPSLKHDKPGVLSMANSGPHTNGSQFFITLVPTPWLDNKHSIFGQVVDGLDVVNTIANVPCNELNKPKEPVTIKTIEIKQVD
ncbi:MAG TPA: peptidylprolyl isomerase [Candidatus Brocadiia bacterium]